MTTINKRIINQINKNRKKQDTRYARQCSITGKGMNEGWIDEERYELIYFKYQKDVIKYIKDLMIDDPYLYSNNKTIDEILNIGYNIYGIYWTDWNDDEDKNYDKQNNK